MEVSPHIEIADRLYLIAFAVEGEMHAARVNNREQAATLRAIHRTLTALSDVFQNPHSFRRSETLKGAAQCLHRVANQLMHCAWIGSPSGSVSRDSLTHVARDVRDIHGRLVRALEAQRRQLRRPTTSGELAIA